ncbi:hypothetical protein Tco_0782917 [Tanacetum coccineum]
MNGPIQCYDYLKYGYYANECTSSRQVEEKDNLVEVEDEDELTLLMARHDEQEERIEPWHIDSAVPLVLWPHEYGHAFGAFGISELDELREIIPKNKKTVVQDLMNSLSQMYERIRKIPEELGIKSALPAPAPAPAPAPLQALSKSSINKRKHMELEPEIKIPGLQCNRALLENAFQRWSDIDKVGMEALVSYLVAASMVQSPENARFNMKLKKLIAEHPDQEKLKSKKVKLKALEYEMN